MKMAKIVQKNLGEMIWYSNTLEHFGRIYSFAKYLLIFSWANLFWYSFVIFLSSRIYSDIHLSNIHGNKYIWIFILSKIWYSSHTVVNSPLLLFTTSNKIMSTFIHFILSTIVNWLLHTIGHWLMATSNVH